MFKERFTDGLNNNLVKGLYVYICNKADDLSMGLTGLYKIILKKRLNWITVDLVNK